MKQACPFHVSLARQLASNHAKTSSLLRMSSEKGHSEGVPAYQILGLQYPTRVCPAGESLKI
jgi:hypothetical protein